MLFEPSHHISGKLIYLEQNAPSLELAQDFLNLLEQNRKHLKYWFQIANLPVIRNESEAFCYLLQLHSDAQAQKSFTYFIYTLTHKLIGLITASRTLPENAGLNIQFWIDKSQKRHGFMKEALHLLEKEFFFTGIERLTICCPAHNIKARKLAVHSGYCFEGTARHIYWNAFAKSFDDLSVFSKIKQ